MNVLRFDPESHTYWRGEQRLESVTEVLRGQGFLPDYAKLDPFYRERGTAVHLAIQLDLHGDLDDDSLDENVQPYVERARRLFETIHFKALWCEGPLSCPVYGYAGTPDALGDSDIGLILPDWKAGQYEPGHEIQVVGGYLPLLEAAASAGLLPVSLRELAVVKPCIVPLNSDLPAPVWIEDDGQRDLFRSALACYRWRCAHVKGGRHGGGAGFHA